MLVNAYSVGWDRRELCVDLISRQRKVPKDNWKTTQASIISRLQEIAARAASQQMVSLPATAPRTPCQSSWTVQKQPLVPTRFPGRKKKAARAAEAREEVTEVVHAEHQLVTTP